MNKIESFTVDHEKLDPGVYVSRRDNFSGVTITTFDIRMKKPNVDRVMSTGSIHALEHLGATFLRNHANYKDKVVYFGPMGCRTGFYLILEGDYESRNIVPLLKELFSFTESYEGDIPGASPVECGNFKDMDLESAKLESNLYNQILANITDSNLIYPEN
ncbi:S-ribosylhomocysteine lyase [Alkalibacter mobilis]|uniref:S-ribosylhomocysteine lyase n=1 Tax=Alkalibacter mobilis TaxID=2787712 RepID=UPI00189C8FAD|nr:S-ribosylhomocysteine lyase [Alkalibacter mobilis]